MRHMLAGPNVGLIATTQASVVSGYWSVFWLSDTIIGRQGRCDVQQSWKHRFLMPLYTYPTEGQEHLGLAREPNLGNEFVESAGSCLRARLSFLMAPAILGRLSGLTTCSTISTPCCTARSTARRYADFLKSDFPRVPLTGDRSLFAVLVVLGKRLTSLHLMESDGDEAPAFPKVGDNRVDSVRYAPPNNGAPGRVFINRDQYFEGVTPETWEFTIGGYRPVREVG